MGRRGCCARTAETAVIHAEGGPDIGSKNGRLQKDSIQTICKIKEAIRNRLTRKEMLNVTSGYLFFIRKLKIK